jgi:hypothetical protein
MGMDENPYRSPETESKPIKQGGNLRRFVWIAAWIFAVWLLLVILALPLGFFVRR